MGLTSSRGKAAGAVAFLDDGDEIVFDELARGVAHQALVVIEQGVELDEVHTTEFDGRHYVSPHLVIK
jgi:L-fucose isomerase-like protein